MKRLLSLFRKPREGVISCLGQWPHRGPTPDWTGPEMSLHPEQSPLATFVCARLAEASEKNADTLRMTLASEEDTIAIQLKTPEGWKKAVGATGTLWSNLAFFLPDIASIESCLGVIKDPRTEDEWRFTFSKRDNEIVFKKLEAQGSNLDQKDDASDSG